MSKLEKYYGSPLNRFIAQHCSREMTCINIDCLLLKSSKKRIRIIESKHVGEHLPATQLEALQTLQQILSKANTDWTVELYIVVGNPPYEEAEIINLANGGRAKLNREELIKWLNFEKEPKLQTPPDKLSEYFFASQQPGSEPAQYRRR